jgi:fatty acid desaturase
MSYDFYRVLHFSGLILVFGAMGGQMASFLATGSAKTPTRKFMNIMHGVGLAIAFVAGFGLIAKLGVGFPAWVLLKIAIWLVLGVLPLVPARKPELAKVSFILFVVLGVAAAGLARYK